MIRTRTTKMLKVKTPGNRRTLHFKKRAGKSLLKSQPKVKRELLKKKVRV
jgi:ribosomal protein L34E